MPNIPGFDTPQLGLKPSEIGPEAFAAAGRRGGAFFNQASQDFKEIGARAGQAVRNAGDAYVADAQHREISHGAATFSQLTDDLTNQWNDLAKNADPNDPSVAAKFRDETLEPALQKFSQAFGTEGGQKWAESHIDALRQHMFQKTTADMATLAGQAARVNTAQTINTLSNTVMNDPSALSFALKSLDTSVGGIVGSSPNLKGAAAGALHSEISERGREQIVKSAALGYIMKTGQVPSWTTDPQYSKYINGIELKQFQKAAEVQTRAAFLQQKQIEAYQREQDNQAVHVATNKAFNDNVSFDPQSGRAVIKPQFFQDMLDVAHKIPNAPNAAATVKTYLDWGESQQRQHAEPAVDDPTTKSALISGLSDPTKPTSELDVLRAATDGKLSTRTTTLLREMVRDMGPDLTKDPIVHSAIQAAGERVGENLLVDGKERFANFMQAFLPQYLKAKRDGTLPPNALDLQDEKSLIRQSMKQFEPTMQERMMAHAMKAAGGGLNFTGLPGAQKPPAPPPVGFTKDGFKFKGGDPAEPKNWEKVQ